MTKILLPLALPLLMVTGPRTNAQSVADLVTQLSFDTEKLTSIKATLQEMYQGYENLEKGYTHIRDIVQGNFNLHKFFLDGLWILSPVVRDDPRITDILNKAYRIALGYKTATSNLYGSGVFSPQELDYIIGVYSSLLQQSLQAAEELTMVSTDNQLRMSDDQRLQALDRIDVTITGQLVFLQQFSNSLSIQAAQRMKEANSINTLKSIYGLPH